MSPRADLQYGDDPPRSADDLDYELPAGAIAQTPLARRDEARLLVDLGADDPAEVRHARVADLPSLLAPGDVVVVNDTRVLPARLLMRRATGGAAEVLLLERRGDGWWEALVKPSRRLRDGERLVPASGRTEVALEVVVGDDLGDGRRLVRPDPRGRPLHQALAAVGVTPLPPYITEPLADPERYQTVYARRPLSAAAPTAGLHLTEDVLAELDARAIPVVPVELVVGLDTFRPVTAARLDDHEIHSERYRVPAATAAAVGDASRVVAIGTTVVRALETWAATGEAEGRSRLFIRRPYRWQVVDVLLTNFHLPRSTLLCLIDAFVGPRWRRLYQLALDDGYRFLSFGDAMLLGVGEPAGPVR